MPIYRAGRIQSTRNARKWFSVVLNVLIMLVQVARRMSKSRTRTHPFLEADQKKNSAVSTFFGTAVNNQCLSA
jgi:hypothetical protein